MVPASGQVVTMIGSAKSSYSVGHAAALSRAFWLPPSGHGNDIPDTAWIPFLEVSCAEAAEDLLWEFAGYRVPAYAAPVRSSHPDAYRIWVGSSSYGTAVNLFVRIVPELISRRGRSVIR